MVASCPLSGPGVIWDRRIVLVLQEPDKRRQIGGTDLGLVGLHLKGMFIDNKLFVEKNNYKKIKTLIKK